MTYTSNPLPLSTVDNKDNRRQSSSKIRSSRVLPVIGHPLLLSLLSTVDRGKGVVVWPTFGGWPGGVQGTPRGVLPEGAFGGEKAVVLMVCQGGDKAVGGMAWLH